MVASVRALFALTLLSKIRRSLILPRLSLLSPFHSLTLNLCPVVAKDREERLVIPHDSRDVADRGVIFDAGADAVIYGPVRLGGSGGRLKAGLSVSRCISLDMGVLRCLFVTAQRRMTCRCQNIQAAQVKVRV